MGDCGAFQYLAEARPLYTCEEVLTYYNNLNFDLVGITLDHVIPANVVRRALESVHESERPTFRIRSKTFYR